uniref:Uncharacterized protein n=1 Tax=Arundo donax TaxID=35708 RepID=A0A0A9FIM9_ARUDO
MSRALLVHWRTVTRSRLFIGTSSQRICCLISRRIARLCINNNNNNKAFSPKQVRIG